ncbi:MAG: hypothetical protein NTW96_13780, partial [Planctomycetia bacterium]|nr:hypothetical protein [Planctomycetia bacterium]
CSCCGMEASLLRSAFSSCPLSTPYVVNHPPSGQQHQIPARTLSCTRLPYLGYIQLDTADVASLESDGSLLAVIEHEIAHLLGFGVIWSDLGLLSGANTSNPGFTGSQAVAAYNAIFGTSVTAVPVEADGGSGTARSHWEESVLDNELMTGWYNSGETNPISRITVASLADLGYQVNMDAADSYTRPSSSSTAAVRTGSAWSSNSSSSTPRSSSLGNARDRLRAVDVVLAGQAMGLYA